MTAADLMLDPGSAESEAVKSMLIQVRNALVYLTIQGNHGLEVKFLVIWARQHGPPMPEFVGAHLSYDGWKVLLLLLLIFSLNKTSQYSPQNGCITTIGTDTGTRVRYGILGPAPPWESLKVRLGKARAK